MQAPAFWSYSRKKPGLLPQVLSPLAMIWQMATQKRLKNGAWEKMPVPVICVGNLTAGGTGKTPAVCMLVAKLQALGHIPHIVSRGYGGSAEGPLRVDLAKHGAGQVGDEPLLLAAFAPTWVARDRAIGVRAAASAGAELVVLDDGFQNPSISKDLSIIVIDAYAGFGNGRVIPAGPLREPFGSGLDRADMLLSIGGETAQKRLSDDWPETDRYPRQNARLQPLETGMDWQGQRVLAFAGIGRPEKFFATLERTGATIVSKRSFPDHAEYNDTVLQRLQAEAKAARAQLVTTEKDAVRLPLAMRADVLVLPVRLESDDWSVLDITLTELISVTDKSKKE